jgi:hypothetical protein
MSMTQTLTAMEETLINNAGEASLPRAEPAASRPDNHHDKRMIQKKKRE